ncbi:MAG: DUF6064 family protein [Roseburia sp.]
MNTQSFWNVIANYNQATIYIQIILCICLTLSCIIARKNRLRWLPKVVYGIVCMFLAFVFFLVFGTEPIQFYFAFPVYLLLGCTFIFEAIRNKQEEFQKLTKLQWALVALVVIYPLVSIVQGKTFPAMLLYIMPCPVVCIGIIIWQSYKSRNLVSLSLLTIWGLTGLKSFFFNAYEDLILLGMGLLALGILVKEILKRRLN